MMRHSRNRSWTLTLLALGVVLSTSAQDVTPSNRIAGPGEPLYYLMADAGPLVTPNEALKRTNRSLLKWWDDLFPRNNNCCNNNNNNNNLVYPPAPLLPAPAAPNNCNGLQLQDLDPFKQMKLFKKLPELFPTATPCGQCGGGCGQNNYVAPAPQSPSYGGDGYGVPPSGGYTKPNPEYDGPGDGDAGYVAPAAPAYEAPAPPAPAYEAPAAPAPAYEAPAPAAPAYETPAPPAPAYEAPAADYNAPAAPAPPYEPPAPSYSPPEATPEVYGKGQVYSQPAQPSYVGAPPAQIVYQPIIYLTTPLASKSYTKAEYDDQKYATPVAPPPPPQAAPVYEAPSQSCYQPAAPPASNYATPTCQTPIRLSLIDQPYRVAPELFEEYNYRLALGSQNLL
ncbi:proline-rich extensin-like protein EPR1 [Drosophila teissieri]|uniref:proline-rich extensin-like protein EPR1 n=1 Tax=Drosophila teissieri TaxID=7243 RepID=UPI001CBA4AA2|nr:proline-rich extensin-like protein EPR1 [Drosophila teissieri]